MVIPLESTALARPGRTTTTTTTTTAAVLGVVSSVTVVLLLLCCATTLSTADVTNTCRNNNVNNNNNINSNGQVVSDSSIPTIDSPLASSSHLRVRTRPLRTCPRHYKLHEASNQPPSFELICTGATGGADMSDLTGYTLRLVNNNNNNKFVQLDGGTIVRGLQVAAECGHLDDFVGHADDDIDDDITSLSSETKTQLVWRQIGAQTISHTHLDHIADFVMMSQELPFGGNFPVYARMPVLEDLQMHMFNFELWPDFFHIPNTNPRTLLPAPLTAKQPVDLEAAIGLQLTAFPLAHGIPGDSTAFLLQEQAPSQESADSTSTKNDDDDAVGGGPAFLAIFDTGPDKIMQSDKLRTVWEAAAPLYRAGRLKGILLESSFDVATPDGMLFGHLTPCYVVQELRVLAKAAQVDNLDGLNVLVMHVKWKMMDRQYLAQVQNEFALPYLDNQQGTCAEPNDLKVQFTFVEQGGRYTL